MRAHWRLGCCLILAHLLAPAVARAQGGAVDLQHFRPAMDSKGHLSVDTTQVLSPGMFSIGLTANFALNPLDLPGPNNRHFRVQFLTSANLQFAIGIMKLGRLPFLELGLGVPVHIITGNASPTETNWDQDMRATASGIQAPLQYEHNGNFGAQGLGDIYLNVKMRFMAATQSPVGLGLLLSVGVPSSLVNKGEQHFMGSGGVTVWPKFLLDKFLDKKRKMLLSVNAGARVKFATKGELKENAGWAGCDTSVAPFDPCVFDGEADNAQTKRLASLYEFTYAVGFQWNLVRGRVDWVSELYGSMEFSSLFKSKKYWKRVFPVEVLTGLKIYLATNSFLAVGAGTGLSGIGPLNNAGAPDFRVLVSFVFEPLIGDRDGDGIKDDVDKCPDEPEDFDDFEDLDGCPEPDNDKDGILDGDDRCPDEPGPGTKDGCPVRSALDRDGDQIPDNKDKCPDDPEDLDAFQDKDGCPDPDNDADRVPDGDDNCPGIDADAASNFAKTKEDHDGHKDSDGCPDPDNDEDKICDNNKQIKSTLKTWAHICKLEDVCPDEPETYNKYKDTDGCPDKPRVKVTKTGFVILDKIYFVTNKAIIRQVSFDILNAIADTLKDQKEIVLVEIEGHTDERGSDAYNYQLSDRRANSVRRFLINKGVNQKRLVAKGYGESRPLCKAHNLTCWSKNRRVVFRILKRK